MTKNIIPRSTTKKKRDWKKPVTTIWSRLVVSREDLIKLLNDHVLLSRKGKGGAYVSPVARVTKKGDDIVLAWEDRWT